MTLTREEKRPEMESRTCLLMRLSALGDVAMLLPYIYALSRQNPKVRFVLLTQPFIAGLIINAPKNLEVMVIDIKHEERSLWHLLRYARRLRLEQFDMVLDLHNVLRTKIIRTMLWRYGAKLYSLRKPRKLRRAFLHKRVDRVPSMLELYAEVVQRSGLQLPSSLAEIDIPQQVLERAIRTFQEQVAPLEGRRWIALAPFSSKRSKDLDESLVNTLLVKLLEDPSLNILLLGGRGREEAKIRKYREQYERVYDMIGPFTLPEELAILKQMRFLISMDSANAHLSRLIGLPSMTLWLGTDPKAGFSVEGALYDVVADGPDCRPCSIFGTNKCPRGLDFACTKEISLEQIVNNIKSALK